MSVIAWTWLVVGLSFGVSLAAAVVAKARATSNYYVVDRHPGAVVSGMATAAGWMSAATFISMAGLVAVRGRDGSAYLVGWTGGYVLLAVLLAPYLRRWGKYTVPQFVAERYGPTARLVALGCAVLVSFVYAAAQIRGVAVVLARFLDVPIGAGVAAAMAAVFFYALLGGMRGLTYSAVAQYVVLIAAYLVSAVYLSTALTGQPVPQLALGGRLAEGARSLGLAPGRPLLETLDALSRDLGFAAYTSGARPRADVLLTTIALMVGTAGLPHVLVRFFTVPRIRDARSSAAWALAFIAILYTTAPAVAAFGRLAVTQTLQGHAYADAPEWFRAWERTGLARFTDRNGDGKMQLSGRPGENEVELDSDLIVLATPEAVGLPPWVTALLAAGALAAAISSAAGLVLTVAAALAHDLLKGTLFPRASEEAQRWASRAAVLLAVLAAGRFALHPHGSIAQAVALAFGLAAATLFPVIVMGLLWGRATKEGAVAGMCAGVAVTGAYMVFFTILRPELDDARHWWLGVSPEGFGAIGMLVHLAVAATVSLATPPPPRAVQDKVAGLRAARGKVQ